MKKILLILLSISLVFVICSCGTLTVKEGSNPGTIIIGDYYLSIVGTPHYENSGTNQFGHYGHSLSVTLQITNNGKESISFDELADMGLAIYGYDGDACVGKMVRHNLSGVGVEPGETEQFTISDSNPSYGASKIPPDHVWGKTFDIEIEFNAELISKRHYDN